jgi:hypothetical protein
MLFTKGIDNLSDGAGGGGVRNNELSFHGKG